MRMANGTGGVVKLNGNRRKPYAARVTVGWESGRQQYKYLGYFATQREALLALLEWNKEPYDLDKANLTFSELYNAWLDAKSSELNHKNIVSYNSAYKNSEALHDMKFTTIRASHMRDCLNNCSKSHATKSKMKVLWNQLYNYALECDIKVTNYSKFVKLTSDVPKEKNLFERNEIDVLWEKTGQTAEDAIILLYTGLRIQELFTLEISNIHLEERYMIGGLKTDAGRDRVIPIHERIVSIIERRIRSNNKYLTEFEGRPFTYQTFNKYWKRIVGKNHKIHDTRKTTISLLHEAEVPIETIRIIVGHSARGVTEQRYLKKSTQDLVTAINKLK